MAIEALTGNNAALWVDVGPSGTPDLQLVGLQRGLTDELTREMIDASHKGSDFTQSVYGRAAGTLTMDALEPDVDFGGAGATHGALRTAFNNKQPITVQIRKTGTAGTVQILEAEALVGTLSTEYPDNDVSVISLELTLQEGFTDVST